MSKPYSEMSADERAVYWEELEELSKQVLMAAIETEELEQINDLEEGPA